MKAKSLLLCVLLAVSLIVSCGTADATVDEITPALSDNPWANLMDYSRRETIHILAPSDSKRPEDMDLVLNAINERMVELINTEIEITLIPLSSWLAMYPVILTGGENVDLIYTSLWSDYRSLVEKNALKEITHEFVEAYMPKSAEEMPNDAWKQAALNGRIYAVPKSHTDSNNYGIVLIRKDIMEHLGIEDIHSFSDYEHFLMACAEDEQLEFYGLYAFSTFSTTDMILLPSENMIRLSDYFIWDADYGDFDAKDIEFLYCTDEYKDHCLKMARWAEAGIWPKFSYASNIHIFDQFEDGYSYSILLRSSEVNSRMNSAKKKGLDVVCRCILDENARTKKSSYNEDMFAISSFSSNPQRAAVCLDILKNDPEINLLCQGGLEGVHYIDNLDGTYSPTDFSERYAWSNWAWALRTEGIYLTQEEDEEATQALEEMESHTMSYDSMIFDGFELDESKIENELIDINQIVSRYMFNFDIGVYRGETEEKYQDFIDDLYNAGLSNVINEYKRQMVEYCKTRESN